jgi:hypothetical protein
MWLIQRTGKWRQLTTWSRFLVSLTWLSKWSYGLSAHLADPRLDPAYLRRLTIKYVLASAAYAVATGPTLVDWRLGIGLAGAVTLLSLRPPERPVYVERPPCDGDRRIGGFRT